MKLPIQSPGNRHSTSTTTLLTGVFPTQLSKRWLASNFRFTTGDLPTSDCCLICSPWCDCCYAFSGFVLKT